MNVRAGLGTLYIRRDGPLASAAMPDSREIFLKQRIDAHEAMLRRVNIAIDAEISHLFSKRDPEKCMFLYCERKRIEAIIGELTAAANA